LATAIATYFEIADLRRQVSLAEELVVVLGEREAMAEERYESGLASSLELRALRVDVRSAQAGLPQLRTMLVHAEGRLAVLLGGYRDDLLALLPAATQPTVTADPVAAGLPATLLYQRPDVRAAGQRLDAARFAIGARRAEQLPNLSLAGTIGLQSADTDGLLDVDQWFRNLVGNLTAPIFQGGRIRKNIALAEARFREAAAAFGRTVVTA
ncbi:MAG: TolC family protein, partial [Gemmatimonadetes bacterium]|nr:TolC family protein [Gemmatimonadota bacterium]